MVQPLRLSGCSEEHGYDLLPSEGPCGAGAGKGRAAFAECLPCSRHSGYVIPAVPFHDPSCWALLPISQMRRRKQRKLPQGRPAWVGGRAVSAPHPSSSYHTGLPPASGSWDRVARPGCPGWAGHTSGELTGHRKEDRVPCPSRALEAPGKGPSPLQPTNAKFEALHASEALTARLGAMV